jgi:ABC-type uncharacterized transport system permease subunit
MDDTSVTIDVDRLRNALLDRFGTAAFSGFPLAFAEVVEVESASPEGLVEIALREKMDLEEFVIDDG